MTLRWDEFFSQNMNNGGGDFWAQLGVSDPTASGGLLPSHAQWTSLNQSAGFDKNGNPLLNAFGTGGNRTYQFGQRPGAFSGGATGGPNSPGGNPGGGVEWGTATGPGQVNAVTTGGAGGAGGFMGAGGGSWWSNPELWTTVLGAGSSYLEQRQANRNAEQANQPRPFSSQTTPWGPAGSNLEFGLAEALRRYQNQPRVGGGRGRGGGGGGGGGNGGGGGGVPGLSDQMQGLLGSMVSRGTNVPSYIQDAQGVTQGMLQGEGSNPFLQGTYGQASNYQNPYADQFIQSMMGAFAPGGGGSGRGGGGGRSNWSGGGGGGGGGGYTPNQWLRASLEGEWLNEGNEEMDALLETMANETREQYLRELAPAVDAEYIRGGRYGSDAYSRAQAYAAEEFGEALAGQQAQTRYANYNDERNRMQDSLGLMTQGEVSAMQAAASRAASAASAGASRYATDAQSDIANRGLLLDAIRGQSSDDLNRMGLMGDMAGLFTNERLGALNAIPGLEEASWMGPQIAWTAGMQDQGRTDDIRARQEMMAARAREQAQANSLRRWQMGAQQDQQRFDDLMRWSLAAGETFGQTAGVSSPNQFIPQGSTAAAALQGGLGGYMFGRGMGQGGAV